MTRVGADVWLVSEELPENEGRYSVKSLVDWSSGNCIGHRNSDMKKKNLVMKILG